MKTTMKRHASYEVGEGVNYLSASKRPRYLARRLVAVLPCRVMPNACSQDGLQLVLDGTGWLTSSPPGEDGMARMFGGQLLVGFDACL